MADEEEITAETAMLQKQDVPYMIDNYDRPGGAYADGLYTDAGTYAYAFTDKPGQRVPKAGVKAEAGIGRAGAHWSFFEAEAKGPNTSASAETDMRGAGVMFRAEFASASAIAGPVYMKVGLGVDTGVKLSASKIEAKLLGCGLTVGSTLGVSLFGSEFRISFW